VVELCVRSHLPREQNVKKLRIRIRIALRQNRTAILFVLIWLIANGVAFVRLFGMTPRAAALVAMCLEKAPGGFSGAYQGFTEVVVFGVVASVVVTNVTRKYRPEETCRALAAQSIGHVVIVGWTNLGKRVWELAAGKSVVVEPNGELVAALVRDEEPVVVGSPQERAVLESAAVVRARVVVIATDDLESAAVACRIVRELNAECELVVRCSDDDVGSVLARTYRARSLSTSRLAAGFIQAFALRARVKKAVVFGTNNVAARTAEALTDKRIAVSHVPATSDASAIASAGVADADLVVLCDDDLGDNLIRVDRIRDLNKRARIVCRAFHEDAAQILTRAPFDCTILSTSRHAVDSLVRAGTFRELGVEAVQATPPTA
jgi:Trk K+ transport system NAD-binding subunit